MSALPPGTTAPPISLESETGQKLSLEDALKKGPALAVFFKANCPTCQFTLPFVDRLRESYAGPNFTIFGVSQNDAADTRAFLSEFGVKFPALIDANGYAVSKQYGLTNVPTLFLIAPGGKIQLTSVGFAKADLEKIASDAARASGKPAQPLFKSGELVPAYKPG